MKKFLFFGRWLVALLVAAVYIFAPEVLGAQPDLILGATFITSSVSWGGKENFEYFLRPMFIGKSIFETQGIKIMQNVQSGQKLNYFGTASKLLKAYVKGFNAVSGAAYTQRTLSVSRMKAEAADDATDFFNTVYEQLLAKGDWNDLSKSGQAQLLKKVIAQIYINAIASDTFRQFWLNNANKSIVTSGVDTGVTDPDYNVYDGMWQMIFENAATSPSDTQIQRVAVSDGAVAQVDTVTLTGSSGTCNITINGVTYLATFVTSLTATTAAFVTSHAAALLLRDITVTSSTDTLIFTANIAGQPNSAPTISAAITGNLTGTNAATTANTAPSALAAGEAEDIFLSLWTNCNKILKNTPKAEKVLIVNDLVLDNYIAYLEGLGTEAANKLLVDGQEYYTYRGIKILPLGWDVHLEADFPHASGELYGYPHRVIYTALNNLILGIDSANDFNKTDMWFNKDEEENRFRTKLIMGCNYVHNELMAVAY